MSGRFEEISSSMMQSDSKQNKTKDLAKTKKCSGIPDNTLLENHQNTSQNINEDQIDSTLHPDSGRPANKPYVIEEQIISDSASPNIDVNDDTTQSLLNMKRKALALLESKLSADEDIKKLQEKFPDPPRRKRHRVRRRRRRQDEELDTQEDTPTNEQQQVHTDNGVPSESELLQASQTVQAAMPQVLESAALSPAAETEPNISLSPIPEVTRNNTVFPRKPRVVYSLDE